MSNSDPNLYRAMGQASSIGMTFAACIVVGVGVGFLLDIWLKTTPWCTIGLAVFGCVAGFYNLIKMISVLGDSK
jgi:ATP synthase protein I